VPCDVFTSTRDVEQFAEEFHCTHKDLFTFSDPDSPIEIISWTAHVSCRLSLETDMRLDESAAQGRPNTRRRAYFEQTGWSLVDVLAFEGLRVGVEIPGPAIVENAFTTIAIDPGATAVRRASGSLSIDIGDAAR
jgi:N-methylhydantoinase A